MFSSIKRTKVLSFVALCAASTLVVACSSTSGDASSQSSDASVETPQETTSSETTSSDSASSASSDASSTEESSTSEDSPPPGIELPQEVIDAAIAEGEVYFYSSWAPGMHEAVREAWAKDFPEIELVGDRMASGDLAVRFSTERQAGIHDADVMILSDSAIIRANPEYFRDFDSSLLPALSEYPSDIMPDSKYMPASTSQLGIAYNTDLVKADEVQSWDDLVSGRFKGKGVMIDPRAYAGAMSFWAQIWKAYGDDFLKKVAEQDFELSTTPTGSSEKLASGVRQVVFPAQVTHIAAMLEQGAPLAVNYPQEGGVYPSQDSYLMLPDDPKHPNAALVLANWLLGPVGQAVACASDYASLNPSVPGCSPLPTDGPVHMFSSDQVSADDQATILGLLGLE